MNPFGPHCPFELVRVSRRQRLITGRCIYVALLLVVLGFIYLSLFGRGPDNLWDFLFRSSAKPRDLANFGLAFFVVFTFVQYFVGTFAMASASASILAEEKERHTLPFLLTTTLADHEIVLGKLTARLAQVFMTLAAGLPVLAIMQVMGGIDPVLLWASFIAVGATIISAACVGAAVSVRAASVKAATGLSVGLVAGYGLLFPYVSFGFAQWIGTYNLLPMGLGAFTVGDFIDWANSGNLIWVSTRLARAFDSSGSLAMLLGPVLAQYLGFHLVVSLATGGWTAWRLRKILAAQHDRQDAGVKKSKNKTRAARQRRPVSQNRPVLWRETATAVTRPGQRAWHRWARRSLFALSFFPLTIAIYEGFSRTGGWNGVGREVHAIVRGIGTIVLCGAAMLVATNAAAIIGREKRKNTMDELCLTRISNDEILTQKALASLWPARWPLSWVAIHWTIDLILGGMHPLTLVFVPVVMSVYMTFAVRLGMMCSAMDSPKIRAGPTAALGMLLSAGLPWLLVAIHVLVFDISGRHAEYTAMFTAGLSPPAAIGFLTLGYSDLRWSFRGPRQEMTMLFIAGVAGGMFLFWMLSSLAWRQTKKRFAKMRPE